MKRLFSTTLIFAFVLQLLQPIPAAQAASLPISAPTAFLLDQTNNRILYSKTPHLKRAPASTTKLLTALVALNLKNPDTIVTIPSAATKMPPSKIYLKSGERYRLGSLIYALLMNSANDSANAIAITTAGSVSAFAREMNATARRLGCKNSNFVNPSGLPDKRQYSTVYDMALIMRETQKYPLLVQALKTRTTTISSMKGRRIALRNHNKMLWRDPREVLGKTGWTRAARHCFVGSINLGDRKFFVAMLGSHRLWKDLQAIVNFHFGAPHWKKPASARLVAREGNKKIQTALKRSGFYRGKIDGQLGPASRTAIRRFQKRNGLGVDGQVGTKTWSLLKRYL